MILHDENFIKKAIEIINTAKHSIKISTFKAEFCVKPYGLGLRTLYEALVVKNSQGVSIQFLLNWNTTHRAVPTSNICAIKTLRARDIDARTLPDNRCCHAKILIIDQDLAIVGSHNLSRRSCSENFEVSYLITLPEQIAYLTAIYDRVWLTAIIPL